MLSTDSPLLRLPINMARKQILFVDALRLSGQMAGFSYQNLERLLIDLMDNAKLQGQRQPVVESIAYAYGVIDAANRFREILRNFPKLKQNEVFKLFFRATSQVEALRNIVQHLNKELQAIGNCHASALGTITWLGCGTAGGARIDAWIIQPGSIYPNQRTIGPLVDLQGRNIPGQIKEVCLQTNGVRVDLSDVVRRIREMLRSLEPSLREHSKGRELLGSDTVTHLELNPLETQEQVMPAMPKSS